MRRHPRQESSPTNQRFRRLFLEPLEQRSLLAVITVTRLDDAVGTGDGTTLREAIEAANTNVSVDGSAAGQAAPDIDSIVFATGLAGTLSLGAGGQLSISETVAITGNGQANTLIDAHGASRVVDIASTAGAVTLSDLTLTNGKASGASQAGGAVRSASSGKLSIQNSTISNSSTVDSQSQGGGVAALGPIDVIRSTISGNSTGGANSEGGGIFGTGAVTIINSTISGNATAGASAFGGGISADSISVTNSTISGNSTAAGFGLGGGLYADSVIIVGSTISGNSTKGVNTHGGGLHANTALISHSTISGNSTTGGNSFGGGIFVLGSLTLTNSTVTANSVAAGDGGGLFSVTGPATIRNSIVAGNLDVLNGSQPDMGVAGTLSVAFSLIGTKVGTTLAEANPGPNAQGNKIGGPVSGLLNPGLGPLADNGGPTKTHVLLPNSPALNAGNNALIPFDTVDRNGNAVLDDLVLFDQRGAPFNRISAGAVDMGAYEYTSLIVTTNNDENDPVPDAADLSLREALAISNSTTIDSILFADSLIGQTITLSLGELTVSKSVKIVGPGPDKLTISGGSGATQSRVFNFDGSGTNVFALSAVTVKDGNGVGVSSGFGGAIRVKGLTNRILISGSVIRDSTAISAGVVGGGLMADQATIEMTNVTVMNNIAGFGGGLAFLEVNAFLTNVTISGNTANTQGGGLLQFANRANGTSQLSLINSTVTDNHATTSSGVRNNTQNNGVASTLTLGNTIVANNTGGGAQLTNAGSAGTIISLGHNITSDANANLTGLGDLPSTDPHLAPLAIADGSLPTHALCTGVNSPAVGCTGLSPAIDAGDNALAKTAGPDGAINTPDDVPLVTDARGLPFQRIAGGTVDIGAFEYFVNSPPTCSLLGAPFFQNLTINDEQGLVTVPGFVNNCTANDPLQSVTSFSVVVSRPDLFITPPSINAQGTLTYDPLPNVHAPFDLTVLVRDNGGTFAQGSDQRATVIPLVVKKDHPLFNATETGARRGLDVTGSTSATPDGFIVAQDVLAVINYINAKGSGPVPENSPFGPPYVDTDGDNQVVANDALRIINWINANPGQTEPEAASTLTTPNSSATTDELFLLLATDFATVASPTRKRA